MAKGTLPELKDTLSDSLLLSQLFGEELENLNQNEANKYTLKTPSSKETYIDNIVGALGENTDIAPDVTPKKRSTPNPFESYELEFVKKALAQDPKPPRWKLDQALQNKESFIYMASELEFPREWTELAVGAWEARQGSEEHKFDEWDDIEFRDFDIEKLIVETDVTQPRPNALQWVMGSFFEAIHPFPVAGMTEEQKSKLLPEPESFTEGALSLLGGAPGMGVGMALIGSVTGGVALPAYVGKFKKAAEILKQVRKYQKAGRSLKAKNLLARSDKAGKLSYVDPKGITRSLVPSTQGLLGGTKLYRNTILKVAETHPKWAKAIDAGARNMLVFPIYGQIKVDVPYSDLKSRGKQAVSDVLTSLMFTAAGTPAIREWTKKAQHIATPSALFLIGAGADIPIGLIPGMESGPISKADRFLHGFGLMTFYYAHHGMSGARLQSKQKQFLREDLNWTEPQIREFMRDHSTNLNDVAIKQAVPLRAEVDQRIWTDKDGKNVDLLRIEERKGLVPQARYMDIETHKQHTMPIRLFKNKFSRDVSGENPKVFEVGAEYNKSKRTWTIQKKDKAGNVFGKEKVVKGVENRDKEISKFDKEIVKNKKDHRTWQKSAKTVESNLGMKDKDYKVIKEALYPDSKGSTINMSAAQLKEYSDIIRNSKVDKAVDSPSLIFLENANQPFNEFIHDWSRYGVLPPVAYLRAAKRRDGKYSEKGKEVSYTLEEFRDVFDSEIGTYADLELVFKDMGLKPKEISKLYGLIDPYFESLVPKELRTPLTIDEMTSMEKNISKKLSGKVESLTPKQQMIAEAVDLIKATLANSADKMARSGVTVTIYTPTGKRKVPMWEAIGPDKKPIALSESQTGISTLRVGDIIIDRNGKKKRIKEITQNHIREDYVHRIITDEARTLFGKDLGFREIVLNKMLKRKKNGDYHDPDAQQAYLDKKTGSEIRKVVYDKFNDIAGWIDEFGVYGRQYARISDLPLEIAFDSNKREIPIDAFNKYKKGDTVDGRVIENIVPMYNMDLRTSLARYGNKVANILAVTQTYGDEGINSPKAVKMVTDIELELGKKVSSYLKGVLEEQIQGPKMPEDPALQTLLRLEPKVTATVANTALSWPESGLKNLVLGQKENFTTFGFLRTARAWGHMAHTQTMADILNDISPLLSRESKYMKAKHEAALIGATEQGTHMLETAHMFKLWPSLMYQTEAANRITATLASRFAASDALDVVLERKTPFKAVMSKRHARHLLEETFNLRNMDEIIERGHFNQAELTKIMQRGHRMTQGSPTVEFMPPAWQNRYVKPLALFHRMAYRVTENQYRNTIIPATKGNLWPMLRNFTAAYGAGELSKAIYYMATGRAERDQFKYMPIEVWNTGLRGEILSSLSNFFDDRGSLKPAIFAYAGELADMVVYTMLAGKEAVDPSVPIEKLREAGKTDEEIKEIINIARSTAINAALSGVAGTAEKAVPFFNRVIRMHRQAANPHIARAKYVHELQSIYKRDIQGVSAEKNPGYGGFNPKQGFYEEIESVFYSDVPKEEYTETGVKGEFIEDITPAEVEKGLTLEKVAKDPVELVRSLLMGQEDSPEEQKRRIFEAAAWIEAHRIQQTNVKFGNIYQAMEASVRNIKAKITSMNPLPQITKEIKGMEAESKFDVFISFLSDEDQVEVLRAQRLYELQKEKWEDAIADMEDKVLDDAMNLFEMKAQD